MNGKTFNSYKWRNGSWKYCYPTNRFWYDGNCRIIHLTYITHICANQRSVIAPSLLPPNYRARYFTTGFLDVLSLQLLYFSNIRAIWILRFYPLESFSACKKFITFNIALDLAIMQFLCLHSCIEVETGDSLLSAPWCQIDPRLSESWKEVFQACKWEGNQ